jgi:hypothetical protein
MSKWSRDSRRRYYFARVHEFRRQAHPQSGKGRLFYNMFQVSNKTYTIHNAQEYHEARNGIRCNPRRRDQSQTAESWRLAYVQSNCCDEVSSPLTPQTSETHVKPLRGMVWFGDSFLWSYKRSVKKGGGGQHLNHLRACGQICCPNEAIVASQHALHKMSTHKGAWLCI